MNKSLTALVLVALVSLGACTRLRVKTQYDKATDFSVYKTFSFVPMRGEEETTRAFSEENQKILNRAITKELEARNYRRVEGDADLKVSNYLSVAEKQKVVSNASIPHSYYGGYYGSYYGYGHRGYSTVEYQVGTLIIHLVDTRKNELVWEGVGTKTLGNKAKDPEKRITAAVEKIFTQFPGAARTGD